MQLPVPFRGAATVAASPHSMQVKKSACSEVAENAGASHELLGMGADVGVTAAASVMPAQRERSDEYSEQVDGSSFAPTRLRSE